MKTPRFVLPLIIAIAMMVSCKKKEVTPQLATVITADVTAISGTRAHCGGNITADGASPITEKGVCWSTNPAPTIADNKTSDGTGMGAFESAMTWLAPESAYYVRAFATNGVGTAYGTACLFNTRSLALGDDYLGGKVAYILQVYDTGFVYGQPHGIIAAAADQNTAMQWYNGTYIATGASATTLGRGSANTALIVAAQGNGTYAAKLCSDLVLLGQNDWYLPDNDELLKLYQNRALIGGFSTGADYWSSTEISANNAWRLSFIDGTYITSSKNFTYRVRAVRSF